MNRSQAKRVADARYEAKRSSRPVVLWRLSDHESDWLNERKHPSESRVDAVRRLLGVDQPGK